MPTSLLFLVTKRHSNEQFSQWLFSAGETATFEFQLEDKPVNVTWMKDNKPLEDPLADRMKFSEGANNTYKMELVHCHESDTGTYIARATNGFENSTCTAHLIVEKCKKIEVLRTVFDEMENENSTKLRKRLLGSFFSRSFLEAFSI